MTPRVGQLNTLDVDKLGLDGFNPRLPEELRGAAASEVLRFLYENEVLEELAQSMLDNGFFRHEPLIVAPEKNAFVVIEGNRRFATVLILLGAPVAAEAEISFDLGALSAAQVTDLSSLPCWVAASRDDVRRFLGFRHISGIRKWSPEAKARYLTDEVERAIADGSTDPFREVGRRVGSNAQGVRNPYLALAVLRTARQEFGVNVRYVQDERFGVWTRCMNATELRQFLGLGSPRTFSEVRQAISNINREAIAEVVSDLTPSGGRRKAVLEDSRDVTLYAAVLTNPEARTALREYGDLDLAGQIVVQASLPSRIMNLVERIDVLMNDIYRANDSGDLQGPAEALFIRASTLRAAVRGLIDDQ